MSISAVASTAANTAQALLAKSSVETTETRENDRDQDDANAVVAGVNAAPTVNLRGQVIGQVVNTQA